MKEHNYAFQNPDTRPRLQSRTQNICFVNSSVLNFQNLNLTLRLREYNERTKLFIFKSQCDVFFFFLAAPEPIINFN